MTANTINDAVTMQPGTAGALLAGRYRVVRQLGQGGMGSVWLAEDTQLDGKLFAIKMLPSILVSNKRAYRQLKDEALVAMQLVHPNIVQIRAFEENSGNPFLVMDYVDGETLDDYLAEKGNGELGTGNGARTSTAPQSAWLPEDEVIRILKPIAAALDYAHKKGVVHRDVKPGNVMVAKDGTPYILDFGIAREIQETMTRVTGKLSSGTLLYMSPEQLNGDPPRPAQDVYSFAAMAYECLKGEPPFSRGNIEFQIMNKVPEPLVGRDVPIAPLADGVIAGLAKKPENRPSTCAAVMTDGGFQRRDAYPPVEGRPQSGCPRGEEQRKEDRRNIGALPFSPWDSFWGILIRHSCIIIEGRMVLLALSLSAVITFLMLILLSGVGGVGIRLYFFVLLGLLIFYLVLISLLRKKIVVKLDMVLYVLVWSILSCGVAFVTWILFAYILRAFDFVSVNLLASIISLCVFSIFMSWRLHVKVGGAMFCGDEDDENTKVEIADA